MMGRIVTSDVEVLELIAKVEATLGEAAWKAAMERARVTFLAWKKQAAGPGDDVPPTTLLLLELRRALDEKGND